MKPWLWLPPQTAHKLFPHFLRTYAKVRPFQTLTWQPFEWKGIEFNNPLGIAGGVDKDAEQIKDWWTLGPGFIEVGTVTPKAQAGHQGYIVDRSTSHQAVWNHLGFPNKGVKYFANQLKKLYQPYFTPIFANIGKNAGTTLDNASDDYVYCLEQLEGLADAFVINISSPNTEGLRKLLEPQNLKTFLQPICKKHYEIIERTNPLPAPILLLKISPDIQIEDLEPIISVSFELGIDGWILTNTTMQRPAGINFPAKSGGISGKPLAEKSKTLLKETVRILGDRKNEKLIVSVGGILSEQDVYERLALGAQLVQVYSALVFEGPFFFRRVAESAHEIKI